MADIALQNSNLYLIGFGRDTNGNKIVKLSFPNTRGFSIQTLGNLKETHRITTKKIDSLTVKDLKNIEKESVSYIKKFGSTAQKSKLKTYKQKKSYGTNSNKKR